MTDPAEIIGDHRWLPHRTNAACEQIQFVRMERADHRDVTFLEEQYLSPALQRCVLEVADISPTVARLPAASLGFIFHSSFALSTLMARVVDAPGVAMGLKEPIILNEIAALSRRGRRIRPFLAMVLQLLGRPFATGETIVVKPGNMANILIPDLLELRPEAHALLMYTPLPDFLRSVARKGMFGRAIYRRNFALLHGDGFFDAGYTEAELFEQTDLQIAAMAWLNHQAQFAQILASDLGPRCRSLDADVFIDRRDDVVTAAGRHLGLALDARAIASGPVFNQHSKQLGRDFDAGERARENAAVDAAHGAEIAMVVEWAGIVARQTGVPLALGSPLLD